MWYLAAFGSNSQRFSGELLVPLFRCCCRFSRDYSDPQSCFALADSCLKTLVAAEVSSSFFLSFLCLFFSFVCVANTLLVGSAPLLRKAGPWVLALTPHPSEGGRHCPSWAAGLRPLPVRFANTF